jgi:hypothetical protein
MKPIKDIEKHWTKIASDQLLGRKIVGVRYISEDERRSLMWDRRCIAIVLDDGNTAFPSMDDEGNGPGALFTTNKTNGTLPVI